MSYFTQEIRDFYRFFRKTPKTEKAIIFYAEHEGYYPYFEGLIETLTNKYNQTISYISSDLNDPILKKSNTKIRTFYLDKLLPFLMAAVECKVFIMTLTDLDRFMLRRSYNPVHYVYVFHSIVSTHMMYREGSFDNYDSILCVGPHHIKEICKYEKMNKLTPKKLIQTGYYRLERIYNAYQKYSFENLSNMPKTILIAPSWGAANVLESCGERLIELLLKNNYKVIVRPHPETVKHFPDLINLFASEFGANPNFVLETSVASDESLLESDILISDYSGVALEYAFGTERPVLFLDVPKKIKNKRFEELDIEPLELFLRPKIGVIVSPEKLESVPQVISQLLAEKADYRQRIAEFRKQYIYNFGRSSEIGAQYIINISKNKDTN
ncbi:CDP-glycerol glycerophosphotransferase family protein [Patescibacteria group bacterium]|nr:CDP-glycerol glycerophosphotransferase family protein [Patescibacteria group bacterium]